MKTLVFIGAKGEGKQIEPLVVTSYPGLNQVTIITWNCSIF